MMEQLHCQQLAEEADKSLQLERRVQELEENLSRRETYMQAKEKKWAEVENHLLPLYESNEALFHKMQDLKLTTLTPLKINNVVAHNQRLKHQLFATKKKLATLRKRLTDPYFTPTAADQPHKEDETDHSLEPQGQNRSRFYVDRLEKALGRAHKMLDDKWFDLKQISRAYREEAEAGRNQILAFEEVH